MTTTQLITANDLEAMGSDARFELIQGVLHEMSPSSYRTNMVIARIGSALFNYADENALGSVTFSEAGFILERDPDSTASPDVAFVQRERLPELIPARGFFPGSPDLAVEVISPTDEPAEIRRKHALYDRVGIPLVWWIDPERRIATVHRPGRSVQQLTDADSLSGEDLVPGFTFPLARLFGV